MYYLNNQLYLKWRGADDIAPVLLDENTFFVTDMYKKLRFTQHPETKEYYLSVIPEDENSPITYDYLKVEDQRYGF